MDHWLDNLKHLGLPERVFEKVYVWPPQMLATHVTHVDADGQREPKVCDEELCSSDNRGGKK